MIKIDKKDIKIIQLLIENSRASHNSIAKEVGLSKNGVTYKIENLVKKGIISGFITSISNIALGITDYEMFIKTIKADNEKELYDYLVNHKNTLVVDRISGEWNIVLEVGFKDNRQLINFVEELISRFSNMIVTYEIYQHLEIFKVNQMPIDLLNETDNKPMYKEANKIIVSPSTIPIINTDETDKRLLSILSNDSAIPLYKIAEELGLTAETVATRIKKLKLNNIILGYTVRLDISKLGYDTYLILLDLKHASTEEREKFRKHIQDENRVRFSFISSTAPKVFIYFASKDTDELDDFLSIIKTKFVNVISNERILLLKEQYKYNLFPEGLME